MDVTSVSQNAQKSTDIEEPVKFVSKRKTLSASENRKESRNM